MKLPLLCRADGLSEVDIAGPANHLITVASDGSEVRCELVTFVDHLEIHHSAGNVERGTWLTRAFVEQGMSVTEALGMLVKHDDLWEPAGEIRMPSRAGREREGRLLALLRNVEWAGVNWEESACPVCHMCEGDKEGHDSDCELAELIAELRAGPSPMAANRLPSGTEGEG